MVSLNHMAGGVLFSHLQGQLEHLCEFLFGTRALVNGWYQAAKVLWVIKHRSPVLPFRSSGLSWRHSGHLLRGPSWDSLCSCRAGVCFQIPKTSRNATPTVLCAWQTALSTIFVSEAEKPRKNVIFRTTAGYKCCHFQTWLSSRVTCWAIKKYSDGTPPQMSISSQVFWSFWVTSLDANMLPWNKIIIVSVIYRKDSELTSLLSAVR